MSNQKKSLKDRALEMTAASLPIMLDREKGEQDDLIGVIVTLRDFNFMAAGTADEYAVYIIDEEPKQFFFAGQVLTEKLRELEKDGYHEDVRAEGIPMVLTKKKGKESGKKYTAVLFYPESK